MCRNSHHRGTSTPTQATTHPPHLCTSIGSSYHTLKREEPPKCAVSSLLRHVSVVASETFGGLDAALASARVPPWGGLLHEGGDLLAGGCVYCTSPRPPCSTPDARAVAPHRPGRPASRSYLMPRVRGFRVRTGDLPYERKAAHPRASPEGGAELVRRGACRTVPWQATDQCLRCHDIRNSQK